MKERLDGLHFYLDGATDADGVAGVYIPEDFRLVKVSVFVTIGGAGADANIDIQDDGVDIVTNIDLDANSLVTLTTAQEVAAASVIEIDLNITEGTTGTATGEIVIWGYWGE